MTENSREIEKSTSDKNISWWDVLASIFALVLNIARLFVGKLFIVLAALT